MIIPINCLIEECEGINEKYLAHLSIIQADELIKQLKESEE